MDGTRLVEPRKGWRKRKARGLKRAITPELFESRLWTQIQRGFGARCSSVRPDLIRAPLERVPIARVSDGGDSAGAHIRLRIDVLVFSRFGVTIIEQDVSDSAEVSDPIDSFVGACARRIHPRVRKPKARTPHRASGQGIFVATDQTLRGSHNLSSLEDNGAGELIHR